MQYGECFLKENQKRNFDLNIYLPPLNGKQ